MTVVFVISFVMAVIFIFVCLRLSAKLDDAVGRITLLEVKTNYYERSEKTLRESVDLQTKCIRDLNDIVRKSVDNKESTEPDTKALLAGWIVEEPELSSEQARQIDMFSMMYKNKWATVYPWQQAELNQVLGPYGIREWRMNE